MAVTCKKCGGPHPIWECRANDKQIAAYQASINAPRPPTETIEVLMQQDDGSLVPHIAVQEKRRGRPISTKPKSPRAEYQRNLMRERRAKQKAEKEGKE